MSKLSIKPPSVLTGNPVVLPLSKSVANRMLIINFLSGEEKEVSVPDCDDSLTMQKLLNRLSVEVKNAGNKEQSSQNSVSYYNAGDAGTVFRFMAALFAITQGKRILGGTDSLNNRPCGPLIEALSSLGAHCSYVERKNYPPVEITGGKLQGGNVEVDASISSQFISALMMIAPLINNGLKIKLSGRPVSQPYIFLTANIMKECGITAEISDSEIIIPEGVYKIEHQIAEGDWSAASYWFAAMALMNGLPGKKVISLQGLNRNSYQGDKIIIELFDQLGVASSWENGLLVLSNTGKHVENFSCNLKDYPDITPALAVACAGLQINAVFTGLETLIIKESNRLTSLQTELRKLGYLCSTESNNTLIIMKGRTPVISNSIDTYNDHRIAMAISLLALRNGNLIINDSMVVNKSYPSFWEHMQSVGFTID